MEDSAVIIIGIFCLIIFVLLFQVLTTKTDRQKAWDRNQKKKRLEEENIKKHNERQRLAIIQANKEAEEQKKLLIKQQRQEKTGRMAYFIGRKIGQTISSTSKLVSDSTQKLRRNIDHNISKHYLTSFSWVWVGNIDSHILFTFKSNNELVITKNGNVEKGSFELLGQNKSILITQNGLTEHYNFVNIDNDYFFLNKVSTHNIIAFVNQDKFQDDSRDLFLIRCKFLKEKLFLNK